MNKPSQPTILVEQLSAPDPADHYAFMVINLDRSHDRLASVRRGFAELGFSLQRIQGIDARHEDTSRLSFNRRAFTIAHGRSVVHPGEIGCYFSHLKALRSFLDTDKDFGLILEDDVIPQAWLADSLSTLIDWHAEWDIVPLFHFHRGGPVALLRNSHVALTVFFGPISSAAAYVVNRRAAEVLVAKLSTMNACFDHALFASWHHGLRIRGVTPMPIRLSSEAEASTINTTPFKKPFALLRLTTFAARVHVALYIAFGAARTVILRRGSLGSALRTLKKA